MDRIWQWAWDRYGARYSWAVFAMTSLAILPVWLGSALLVVAFEKSDRYVEAAAVTVAVVVVMVYMGIFPGWARAAGWTGGRPAGRSIGRGHWRPPRPGVGRRWSGRRGRARVGSHCSWSLSVRSPGRRDRGSFSTESSAPSSALSAA